MKIGDALFYVLASILAVAAVVGVVFIFMLIIVTEFGERTYVGQTAPGDYGCYYVKYEYDFYGIEATSDDYVCPYSTGGK